MKYVLQRVAVFFLTLAVPLAAQAGSCKSVYWREGRVFTVKGALYRAVHITLPESLLGDPVVGDANLWEVDGQGNHVFVMPNSAEPEGRETTLTVIDRANCAYHFTLKRVSAAAADTCLTVEKGEGGAFGDLSALEAVKSPQDFAALEQRIKSLQQALLLQEKQQAAAIETALQKYRAYIYTRYDWTEGLGFKGVKLISDVYDDGRFTYIRVAADNRGLLAASATIDGKKEMLEYRLDSPSLYVISGIYPQFSLKYGKSEVQVKRRDNRANGAF